ncbi:MAG: prevent-host-death protein [Comamonadaceae bacterium CG17_big_fil_post_rev_8_21_14_2_50_60_13]|nr:MAG: prevent-host-death protein [Comamonadaceae bacterium CG17_big_fil_post_rev_8_21_14_2_50_60_13]
MMRTITASQAKQNFGALLGELSHGPVAIERHHKTVAVVMLPESVASVPDPRQAARTAQKQLELQRLMRHQQWALSLLCATPSARQKQLKAARQVVKRWQDEQLCSADYIERWQQWLACPVSELAKFMCGDAHGWGPAMRQNSPFTSLALVQP